MSNPLEDKLADLAKRFAAQAPGQAEAVRILVREGNTAALGELAHKLAGIAGMLGHPSLGQAAIELEEAIERGDDPRLATDRLLRLLDAL